MPAAEYRERLGLRPLGRVHAPKGAIYSRLAVATFFSIKVFNYGAARIWDWGYATKYRTGVHSNKRPGGHFPPGLFFISSLNCGNTAAYQTINAIGTKNQGFPWS